MESELNPEENYQRYFHNNDVVRHDEDNSRTLAEIFEKGLEMMQKAETVPKRRQDMYNQARRLFEQATELIETLSLFSDNETIEEVSTNNLKYILVPAYLAKILISGQCGLQTFIKAAEYIRSFLIRIVSYNLCENRSYLQDIIDKATDTESMYLRSQNVDTSLESAMRARNEKIEKYKKTKLLEERLEELRKQMSNISDDELVREYYLNLIRKLLDESVESLEREIKPALYFERNRVGASGSTPERKVKQTKQTFTIVKNNLQKQVFGMGYPSLPTVTVDEFITTKMESGELAFQKQKEVYANSLQRYAEKPNLLREQEEASDEERDLKEERDDKEEISRKRRWDEFKDENPRGSGNRHNMG